jgi:hypothetical protein
MNNRTIMLDPLLNIAPKIAGINVNNSIGEAEYFRQIFVAWEKSRRPFAQNAPQRLRKFTAYRLRLPPGQNHGD